MTSSELLKGHQGRDQPGINHKILFYFNARLLKYFRSANFSLWSNRENRCFFLLWLNLGRKGVSPLLNKLLSGNNVIQLIIYLTKSVPANSKDTMNKKKRFFFPFTFLLLVCVYLYHCNASLFLRSYRWSCLKSHISRVSPDHWEEFV